MENYWYAVMRDHDDDDWSYGSFDLDRAKAMAKVLGDDAYIAVIEESKNSVCIEEIEQWEF